MRPKIVILMILILGAFLVTGSGQAQVIREEGVKTIAGILYPDEDTAEWSFASLGGEILFASLDADIYREAPGGGGHETSTSADSGGCSDGGGGCSGDDSGGCSGEGGPGLFYIQVEGPEGVICQANKPAPPPGWMRDPRMACVLPDSRQPVTYIVRVGLKVKGENIQDHYGFLLNVSLRKIAPTGVNIQAAIALSGNYGF